MIAPRGLHWWGGKNSEGLVGAWVLSLLPPVASGETYIEPFCGMLGILLARERADHELANDLSGGVAAFWRTLRYDADAFEERLSYTECGREVFEEAKTLYASAKTSDFERAWALTVLSLQSYRSSFGSWNSSALKGRYFPGNCERLTSAAMRERIRHLNIENRDGAEVIAEYASRSEAVIYCDPPYPGTSDYPEKLDYAAFVEALAGARAKVAISGYPTDLYDGLGYRRFERRFWSSGARDYRTEVVWTNYDPADYGEQLALPEPTDG